MLALIGWNCHATRETLRGDVKVSVWGLKNERSAAIHLKMEKKMKLIGYHSIKSDFYPQIEDNH